MLRVAIFAEGEPPRVLAFGDVDRVSFGRAPECSIVLRQRFVSRLHGEFVQTDGAWYVVDRGSKAGSVLLRGGAVPPFRLSPDNREALQGGEDLLILGLRMRIEIKPAESVDIVSQGAPTVRVSRVAENALSEAPALEQNLHRDSEKLELLLDLAKDLNQLEDPEEVLVRISRAVFDALPHATHFSICVPEKDGSYSPSFGTERDQSVPSAEVTVSSSLLEMAVERESAMLFRMTDREASPSESMLFNSIASAMAVPLRGARGIAGIMVVDNRSSDRPFDTEDLDLMVVVSNSAAFALERAQHRDQVRKMFDGFVDATVSAIESRDPTTSGHSRRVASLTVALAEAVNRTETGPLSELGFSFDQLKELSYAGLLHDFGKVGVPECVLLKARKLHPEQRERIETRFQLIRAVYRNAVLLEALEATPATRSREEALRAARSKASQMDEEIAEALRMIQALDSGRPLDAECVERLRCIGQMSFADIDGRERPFLAAEEAESLLITEGTLTPGERREIEEHVIHSYRALRQLPWPRNMERLPDIVIAHHEKLDGSGYPRGVRGEQIGVEARMLTVCDIYDALTAADRPYRFALPVERGLDLIREEAQLGKIDPQLVDLFIEARVWDRVGSELETAGPSLQQTRWYRL